MHNESIVDVKQWIDSRPMTGQQWLVLVLCFVIVLFDGMDVAIMGFIAPALMQDWQISKAAFGPVMSATMIGLAVGALIAGPYADRFGRRSVLVWAVSFFGLFSLASAFARNPYELAALRFLTGLGLGAAMPNTSTLLSEYLPERYRSLLITVMFTGFNLGSGGAGFVAAWLLPQHGWQGVLLAGGIMPLCLLPILWMCLPESARFLVANNAPAEKVARLLNQMGGFFTPETRFVVETAPAKQKTPVRQLFSKDYRLGTFALWTTYFMGLLVIYLTMGWLPTLIRESGISVERAATVTAMFQIGGTLGAILVGLIMDRCNPNGVIASSYTLGGIFILSLGAIGLSSDLLMAGVVAAGFCISGAQTGLNAFAPGYYPTESRATGVSWMLGIGRFGAILGSMIGGVILSMGLSFSLIFSALAVPAFIAALAILINGYTSKRVSKG